MTELTAEELRELPKKDTWSDDDALALYETTPDGWELCCGAPIPMYVETTADRVRWSHCARIASIMMGESAANQGAGQLARTMFTNRKDFVA